MTTVDCHVHAGVMERLTHCEATGRLAHAYLFIGPVGIGKAETARAFAQFLQCEDDAARQQGRSCGVCPYQDRLGESSRRAHGHQ